MTSEEINLDSETELESPPGLIEPKPEKKADKRKFILIGIGFLVLLCICLQVTGLFRLNLFAGGITIEELVVTDEVGPDEQPLNRVNKTDFEPTGRIYAAVYTSGVDATVGMRWYHDETLLFEHFDRTQNNYIATFLEGGARNPLPAGEYRVEVHLGVNSDPIKTVRFNVEPLAIEINPPITVPEGHEDIENSPNLEVPFIFDEIWLIDGQEWHINEIKIVFLKDAELFVVVVETDSESVELSKEALEDFTRPVARYAVENGYWEQAREIQINGETHELDEPLAITVINPDMPGVGNRARFHVGELMDGS